MVQRSVRRAALATLGAAALATWATWPLAAHLRTHVYDPTRHGGFFVESIRADVRLVLWILAWDVHALATAPAHLWDANIFHPAPHALALSEHLLGALPVYAPLALASGDPVFAHQATLLATFAGALLAMGALARAWTGSDAAAVLAASLFAFSPFRGAHLGALQIEGSWMLPLVVLAAWRSTRSAGLGWPTALALAIVATALHSAYLAYGVFAATAVLVATLLALDAGVRAAWPRLVVPLAAAAAVLAASAQPYLAMRSAGALHDPRGEFVALTSAAPGQTGATLAVVVAVLTAAWWRRGLAGVRPAWLAALAVAGLATHLLAIGPAVHAGALVVPGPWALAAALVPGFETLRIPLRLNAFATVAASLLAAVGVAGLARAVPAPRTIATAALGLALLAAARLGRVPLEPIETRATLPPIYEALVAAPAGPVLEIPWHDFERLPMERGTDALRTYRSVYHWRRLLNGYSGYAPRTYGVVSALAHAAPAPEALALLARATGLRYVVVHAADLDAEHAAAWDGARGLTPVAREGTDVLYALASPPPPDLVASLVADDPVATTLAGTPLAPLPPDGRVARLRAAAAGPTAVRRRLRFALDVAVTNASARTWPSLTKVAPHLVTVGTRWSRAEGSAGESDDLAGRLPFDLSPGGTARVEVGVRAPDEPGAWRLSVGVVQDGTWLAGDPLSVAVEVR